MQPRRKSIVRHLVAPATLLLLLGAPLSASETWLGVITKVQGNVYLQLEAGRFPAVEYGPLPLGTHLEFEEGAWLNVLCSSNGRVCRLKNSGPVLGTACWCLAGLRSTGGGSDNVAAGPPTGRTQILEKDLVLGGFEVWGGTRSVRPESFWEKPFLMSPRCPSELSGRLGCGAHLAAPEMVRWLVVDGVSNYRLSLTGPGGQGFPFHDFEPEASSVTCAPVAAFGGHRACEAPWPRDWPLVAGEQYRLEVLIQSGDGIVSSGETTLSMLGEARAAEIRKVLDQLPRSDLADEPWVRSLVYSGAGLFNEAATLLESESQGAPTANQRIALGMALQRLDIPEQTAWIFEQLEDEPTSNRPLVDLHYGQALSDLGRHNEALEHLGGARTWYRELGLPSFEAQTLEALSHVYRRLGEKERAEELFLESQDLREPVTLPQLEP